MSVFRTESDTLLLSDPSRSRSIVHVGVTHPTPSEEAAFGKLYLLVEIDTTDRINHDIIGALQEELRTVYYRSTEFSAENAFEQALQRANERLHRFITEGVTQWVDKFNGIVAVVKNDLLTFSVIGRVNAFLIRGARIVDITGRTSSVDDKRNPLKLFSSVLTGHLQQNDNILLCTSSLLDYFSQEKLKRMIIEDVPSGTIARIEQTLISNSASVSFAALVFAFKHQEAMMTDAAPAALYAPLSGARNNAPERSMEELNSKERTTEQLLSPSVMPNVRSALGGMSSAVVGFVRKHIFNLPPRRRVAPQVQQRYTNESFPARPERRSSRVAKNALLRALVFLLSIPRVIVHAIGYRRTVRSTIDALPQRTTGFVGRTIQWIRSLTGMQRAIMLAAIVALFVLSQSIISLSNRAKNAPAQTVEEKSVLIRENMAKATAALTYDDFDGAKKLVDDSTAVIATLANRSKKDKALRAELLGVINAVREKTRRVQAPTLTTVADVSGSLSGASPRTVNLAGTTLVIGTDRPSKVVRYSIKSNKVLDPATVPFAPTFALALDQQTVLFGNDRESALLNLKESAAKPVDITFPNADRSIVAAATFSSRIYFIDTKNNSILRAARSATAVGVPGPWLKERTDLGGAVGLAVDGSIYLIASNGDVKKFTAGTPDARSVTTVDPALHAPVAVWTNERTTSLYILEPSERRLLEYKKGSGSLIAQYVDDAFKDVRAMTFDETGTAAYFMSGTTIKKIDLKK